MLNNVGFRTVSVLWNQSFFTGFKVVILDGWKVYQKDGISEGGIKNKLKEGVPEPSTHFEFVINTWKQNASLIPVKENRDQI